MSKKKLRLNLGAGREAIKGFVSIDRKLGTEVYPLQYEDGTVDEIRASHVLEHFSHREVGRVFADWVRVLKPGGVIRIAVPNFEHVSREYLSGKPINVQGFVMGGHTDSDDHHGCIFDREALTELFISAGLEQIRDWKSNIRDCASLHESLNLEAVKPISDAKTVSGVYAVLASARVGYALHHKCAHQTLPIMGIPYKMMIGCFWHQILSEAIDQTIANPACRYVLTCDFDTVFDGDDIRNLYRLMEAVPETDAVASVQSKRGSNYALFTRCDEMGRVVAEVPAQDFRKHLTPIDTAHFGLTMFRADSLRKLPRPWMNPSPNKDGNWRDGQTDADISFWRNWRDAGMSLHLANGVVVGHLEEKVTWPGENFAPVYQDVGDYLTNGKPMEAARCLT